MARKVNVSMYGLVKKGFTKRDVERLEEILNEGTYKLVNCQIHNDESKIVGVKYGRYCKVCGVEITSKNIRVANRFDRCKSCWAKYVKEQRWKNRGISDVKMEKLKERHEKSKKNKEIRLCTERIELERLVKKANLAIDGKCTRCGVLINEENRYKRKSYCKSCYKEPFRVRRHKRRRNFGFSPLNGGFDDSHVHHIDYNYIVYIPIELHKSVFHKMEDGTGMVSINLAVFLWIVKHYNELMLSANYIYSLYLTNNMMYLENKNKNELKCV